MSIRIDSDRLAGTSASQTGQAEQIRSSGSKFSGISGSRGFGRDSIEISSMAGGIADASAAQAAQSADRVRQLAAIYSAGRYQADSFQVSKAMVSGAITGGVE